MADFTIECSDELMAKIEAIAFSETKIEVGGFLVGTYDENGAVVTEVLPARHSVGQSTQLTFTHDTWNALYEDLNEVGGALVGWFHSHPNFGVFLSEHDKFIQQNFFGANGNITIVVDPIRGRRGWFYSKDGKIKVYQKEEDTTRNRLGVSATNADENIEAIMGISNNGVTTGKVMVISAVMSLLGTFLGYGLSVATNTNSDLSSQVAQLQQQVFFLQNPELASQPTVVATKKAAPSKAATQPSTKSTAPSAAKSAKKQAPAKGSTTGETKTAQTLGVAKVGTTCNPTLDKVPVNGLKCIKTTSPTVGKWRTMSTEIKPNSKAPTAGDTATAG